MPASFQLELVTPEKLCFSDEVLFVTVPGQEGLFGVLPGHAPFISAVRPGIVQIGENDDAQFFAVSTGYAEVLPSRVTLLVDEALAKENIDAAHIEKTHEEIAEKLAMMVTEDPEYLHLKNRLQFTQACIELSHQGKK